MDNKTNVVSLKDGIKEINRSKHFNKLAVEMAEIQEMQATMKTKEMIKVKTYCEKEEYTHPIYDKVLDDRFDVLHNKMIELKNSKGE